MQQARRPPRSATEAKAPRRELDVNRERLIWCLTSLIGNQVTAKLRGNVIYEGLFHCCALEGDYSITLKHARLIPSDNSKSVALIETLVIPGKDFLQVTASGVPRPAMLDDDNPQTEGVVFATDSEISSKHGSGRQEMFRVNEEKYGVSTTFAEDVYTTKLDPTSIPREKRDEADRLAKEIENGNQAHAKDDGAEDEEARFSAVTGTGAYSNAEGGAVLTGSSAAASSASAKAKARSEKPISSDLTIPIAKAGSVSAAAEPDDAARDYRRQRGMIVAHQPINQASMISEMKRINALNLEPAVPKLDDKTGNDWLNFKQSQTRNKSNPSQGDLKQEFEQSLAELQRRDSQKAQSQELSQVTGDSEASGSSHPVDGRSDSKKFSFNPNAKDFTFNPNVASFTPSSASNDTAKAPAVSKQPSGPSGEVSRTQGPPFSTSDVNSKSLKLKLVDILDCFAKTASRDDLNKDISWPEATGASYRDVLGQPSQVPRMPMNAVAAGAPMPGQWRQQQGQMPSVPGHQSGQGQMGAAPGRQHQQMMGQQGFAMVSNASNNQPPQMFQPMFAPNAPNGNQQMRPPNNQQMLQGGQPGNMPNMAMPKMGMAPQGMVMMVPAGSGGMVPGFAPMQPGQPGQMRQAPPSHPGGQQMMRPMYSGQMS